MFFALLKLRPSAIRLISLHHCCHYSDDNIQGISWSDDVANLTLTPPDNGMMRLDDHRTRPHKTILSTMVVRTKMPHLEQPEGITKLIWHQVGTWVLDLAPLHAYLELLGQYGFDLSNRSGRCIILPPKAKRSLWPENLERYCNLAHAA